MKVINTGNNPKNVNTNNPERLPIRQPFQHNAPSDASLVTPYRPPQFQNININKKEHFPNHSI